MKTKMLCLVCVVGMVVGGLVFALQMLQNLKEGVGV